MYSVAYISFYYFAMYHRYVDAQKQTNQKHKSDIVWVGKELRIDSIHDYAIHTNSAAELVFKWFPPIPTDTLKCQIPLFPAPTCLDSKTPRSYFKPYFTCKHKLLRWYGFKAGRIGSNFFSWKTSCLFPKGWNVYFPK